MDLVAKVLKSATFGNPHTVGPSSQKTKQAVDQARREVLSFFGVSSETHIVVFTSGATGGIKLVGESFPWTERSMYYYQQCAHTSILGRF